MKGLYCKACAVRLLQNAAISPKSVSVTVQYLRKFETRSWDRVTFDAVRVESVDATVKVVVADKKGVDNAGETAVVFVLVGLVPAVVVGPVPEGDGVAFLEDPTAAIISSSLKIFCMLRDLPHPFHFCYDNLIQVLNGKVNISAFIIAPFVKVEFFWRSLHVRVWVLLMTLLARWSSICCLSRIFLVNLLSSRCRGQDCQRSGQ